MNTTVPLHSMFFFVYYQTSFVTMGFYRNGYTCKNYVCQMLYIDYLTSDALYLLLDSCIGGTITCKQGS